MDPEKKCLLIVYSYHHRNTQKVAEVFAKVLKAEIRTPQQTDPTDLQGYDLVGFGSGIDSGRNYKELLDFARQIPPATNTKAFVFSTSGMPAAISGRRRVEEYTSRCHTALKETLRSKGYMIVGEFGCAGFNTNSFLKHLGGINKGRPDAEDLKCAEEFALKVKEQLATPRL